MQDKLDNLEANRDELRKAADTIEAIHKLIGDKYAELKSNGFLSENKTDYESVFNDYITKVRSMLDNEVLVWKEALKQEEIKAGENRKKSIENEHLIKLEREVSNIETIKDDHLV